MIRKLGHMVHAMVSKIGMSSDDDILCHHIPEAIGDRNVTGRLLSLSRRSHASS
jgi:hypothetical protein